MKISEFSNQAYGSYYDYLRTNLFSVEFYKPTGLPEFYNGASDANTKRLSYMCKSISIPGKSVGTIDAKRFGPIFKVANDMIVDTVAMTFMCSAQDMLEHRFFEGWIAAITGNVKDAGRQKYTLSYYDQYWSTLRIVPVTRLHAQQTPSVVLEEAYPTNVGPIELAWGDSSDVATFTVTFTMRDWRWDGDSTYWADSEN